MLSVMVMQFAKEIVDNILVWANTMAQLLERVNIILSKTKFTMNCHLPAYFQRGQP